MSTTAAATALGRAERIVVMAALAACALVVVATIGDASFAMHNDGPQYAFAAEVHSRYQATGLGWPEIYQLNWPTTVRGALEIDLLARALGAGRGLAHTIVLDVALLSWLGAFFALVLRLCPRRWPAALLGLGTAFQLSFELGVLSFCLGSAAALLVIALEVGARRSSVARDVLLLVALYLVARIHVQPAALAGVVVVAMRAAGPRPLRDVVAAIIAGVPAMMVALATTQGFSGEGPTSAALGPSLDGLHSWARDFLSGSPWRGVIALLLAITSVVLLVRDRATRSRVELALAGAALAFLIAAVVVPEDLFGWQLFRPRLLPLAFAVLLALLPVERLSSRERGLVAAMFLVFGVAGALEARRDQQQWQRLFRPVIEGLRQAPPQPRSWAAIVTAVDGPVPPTRITPWLHVAQLAAVELGGRPAYMQDDEPSVHAILARAPPRSLVSPPFPAMWAKAWAADLDGRRHFEVVRALAAWGLAVDGLVVYGRPDDREALVAGGQDVVFELDVAFDRVVYSTNSVGCAVDVEVGGPAEPVMVGIGFVPGEAPLDVAVVLGAGGVARFAGAPCGAVWIEVDGAPCVGADAGGRLRGFVDRGEQPVVVRCERLFEATAPP